MKAFTLYDIDLQNCQLFSHTKRALKKYTCTCIYTYVCHLHVRIRRHHNKNVFLQMENIPNFKLNKIRTKTKYMKLQNVQQKYINDIT